ncbi:hypothetical protein QW131_07835 [Roseibium salinum]|nr:hypothetical protein [Roseibium salinum]
MAAIPEKDLQPTDPEIEGLRVELGNPHREAESKWRSSLTRYGNAGAWSISH